jgi:primosomal replication protein N
MTLPQPPRPNWTVTARLEVCGRLVGHPVLRVTPAGTAVLSLSVDCGRNAGEMLLPVVITGQAAREMGSPLRLGAAVRASGSLQPTLARARAGSFNPTFPGVEVVADEVTLAEAPG